MADRFSRTRLLIGEEGLERLRNAHVAVIGLGGVGGYALEALARAGVGRLFLADADIVEISNVNRQILSLDSTLGLPKADVARERVRLINPNSVVHTTRDFLSADNIEALLPETVGYAVDAIDSILPKTHLIATLIKRNVCFVSCMGTASKLQPTGIRVADLSETRACPLARAVRQQLRRHGIRTGVRCVFSEENQGKTAAAEENDPNRKRIQGTISYIPGIAGLTAAGIIINDILTSDGDWTDRGRKL